MYLRIIVRKKQDEYSQIGNDIDVEINDTIAGLISADETLIHVGNHIRFSRLFGETNETRFYEIEDGCINEIEIRKINEVK